MLSRIIALALASLIYVQPAWATPYWQTVSHEIAAKTYASAHFCMRHTLMCAPATQEHSRNARRTERCEP